MFTKAEKNYFINMTAAIIGFACAITGFMLKFRNLPFASYLSPRSLHEVTGYLITGIVIVHLLMHTTWIKSLTKNLLTQKKTAIGVVASVLLPIAICAAVVSTSPAGDSRHFPGGGKQFNSENGNKAGQGEKGFPDRGYDNSADSLNDESNSGQGQVN